MIGYQPDDRLAHRLDPRSKLAFQFGFAIAAVTHVSTAGLLASLGLSLVALRAAGLSARRVLGSYRVVLLILLLGPTLAGLRFGSPWIAVGPALDSARSVARVVPVLLVGAGYVRSTPVRDTRAAIQWAVPGRPGALLAVGVGLTVRFLPLLRADVARRREAIAVRGGERRPVRDRAGRLALLSVRRALDRATVLSAALRARCFAYNPTLPVLAFETVDGPVIGVALLLALSPLL